VKGQGMNCCPLCDLLAHAAYKLTRDTYRQGYIPDRVKALVVEELAEAMVQLAIERLEAGKK